MRIAELQTSIALRSYELTEEGYNRGTVEQLDLEDARQELLEARQNLLSTRYAYLSALISLRSLLSADSLSDSMKDKPNDCTEKENRGASSSRSSYSSSRGPCRVHGFAPRAPRGIRDPVGRACLRGQGPAAESGPPIERARAAAQRPAAAWPPAEQQAARTASRSERLHRANGPGGQGMDVERGRWPSTSDNGDVVPRTRSASIGTAGRLISISVKVGDSVTKGASSRPSTRADRERTTPPSPVFASVSGTSYRCPSSRANASQAQPRWSFLVTSPGCAFETAVP
jgi:hypothetical protein